jgi:hypothetical protein
MHISTRTLALVIVAVTLLKLVFAAALPIKNDEAYYLLWAQHLSSGYYDHPPMIAWLLHLMSYVSGSIVWFRMLALASGLVAVWVVYRFALFFTSEESARFAALLFVLSPLYILLFLISNDAPLLLFSSLGLLLFYIAIRDERPMYALGSGALLGAAFLSKYLVAPLGIALAIYSLAWSPKKRWPYLALAVVAALPFVLQHLYYNYTNCWNTVNFHLFLRNEGTAASIGTLVFYFVGFALIMTPWSVAALLASARRLTDEKVRYLLVVVITTLSVFALASIKTIIGLHFFLVFAPYLFALYAILEGSKLRKWLVWFSSGYAVLFLGFLVVLTAFPLDRLQGWKHHADFVLGLAPEAVCEKLETYSGYPLFSDYYANAAILSYECHRPVNVLFSGSRYGREFDRWTDYEALNGKNLAMVVIGRRSTESWEPYFETISAEVISVRGAPFTVIVGKGFRLAWYREKFLDEIRRRYYQPPSWLPLDNCVAYPDRIRSN